nr:3D domain-containing protein [Mycobacterium sp. E3298]
MAAENPVKKPDTPEEKYADIKSETYLVTAYTAGYESTQKHKGEKGYGITASGATVKENHTIACAKSLEFGTQIYIPELNNVYECQDRGSKIRNNHIDIYMENLDDALAFGKQKLEVKVLPNRED